MFEPVKVGFGHYMGGFYSRLVPSTKPLQEYVARGLSSSIVIAKACLIGEAEEMLGEWLRNETGSATRPYKLPIIILAIAADHNPTGRDFTRQIADFSPIMLPNDAKERMFECRTIAADIRAQVVVAAQDEPTARSLAAQFCLFIDEGPNRWFNSTYRFAGVDSLWPVALESSDVPFMRVPSRAGNLTILAGDLTLRAQVPIFRAPAVGQPNDGKGVPGTDDPAGYPLSSEVEVTMVGVSPWDGREPQKCGIAS